MKVTNTFEYLTNSFSLLIYFLNIFGLNGLILISIIIFIAGRAQKVLDTATKVVTISTGSTVLYNNWVKGESSDDKDENKKDDDKNDKKEETKEDKPTDPNESNEK